MSYLKSPGYPIPAQVYTHLKGTPNVKGNYDIDEQILFVERVNGKVSRWFAILPRRTYATAFDVTISGSAAIGDRDNTSAFNTTLGARSIADVNSEETKSALGSAPNEVDLYGFLHNFNYQLAETSGKLSIHISSILARGTSPQGVSFPTNKEDWDLCEWLDLDPPTVAANFDFYTAVAWLATILPTPVKLDVSRPQDWPRMHFRVDTYVTDTFDAGDEHLYINCNERMIVGSGYTADEIIARLKVKSQFGTGS